MLRNLRKWNIPVILNQLRIFPGKAWISLEKITEEMSITKNNYKLNEL